MAEEPTRTSATGGSLRVLRIPGGLLAATGPLLAAAGLSFHVPCSSTLLWLGAILFAFGAGAVAAAESARQLQKEPRQSCYQRYLTGLGCALFVLCGTIVVSLAGLASAKRLNNVLPLATQPTEADLSTSGILVISLLLAVVGALFFVINAVREKRDGFEEFDRELFWSGLAYRLGEAVLFVIFFFLVMRRYGSGDIEAWLPVLALIVGMFVKVGERLVFGLAKRALAAMATLIPLDPEDLKDKPSSQPPTPYPVGRTNGNHSGDGTGSSPVMTDRHA